MKINKTWGTVAFAVISSVVVGADVSFFGDPASKRERWNALKEAHGDTQKVIDDAVRIIAKPMPGFNEEDYLLYTKTGDRVVYQDEYEGRLENLRRLAFAECLEYKGRFLSALREYIDWMLSLRSWVLPAHDDDLASWNGKPSIDLMVARNAQEIALIYYWLGNELGVDVKKRIREELEKRVFAVFERELKVMDVTSPDWRVNRAWWLKGNNNWNAVCYSGVAAALMMVENDDSRRDTLLAAASKNAMLYFNNIPSDGYCEEGAGYWSYGFGRGMNLLLMFDNYRAGALALKTGDNVCQMAAYGSSFLMVPGRSPTISDCGSRPCPSAVTAALAAKRYPEEVPSCYDNAWSLSKSNDLLTNALLAFAPSRTTDKRTTTALSIRNWWPSFTVLISRQEQGTAHPVSICVNGGSNRSSHAHHDAGSYSMFIDDVEMLCDPGSPVYKRSTFGKDRYKNSIVNSYGHSVPVLNGKLQGRVAQDVGDGVARQISHNFTDKADELILDLRPAYGEAGERKLERKIVFDRIAGSLTVEDHFELEQEGSFEVPFITKVDVTRKGNFTYVLQSEGHRIEVRFEACGGEIEEFEDEVNDVGETGSGIKRIAVRFKKPVKSGCIKTIATKQ